MALNYLTNKPISDENLKLFPQEDIADFCKYVAIIHQNKTLCEKMTEFGMQEMIPEFIENVKKNILNQEKIAIYEVPSTVVEKGADDSRGEAVADSSSKKNR